jgi:hypothetical protein
LGNSVAIEVPHKRHAITSIVFAIEERTVHFPKGLIKSRRGMGQPIIEARISRVKRSQFSEFRPYYQSFHFPGIREIPAWAERVGDARQTAPHFCIRVPKTTTA